MKEDYLKTEQRIKKQIEPVRNALHVTETKSPKLYKIVERIIKDIKL